jgi:(5-formylfuran-3-yl)methyl phosphate synthase
MFLLVSVANPADAAAALAGGADLIDAKDPAAGALGAVTPEMLREIQATVAGARPVTAALGDAADEDEVERAAREFAAAGALFVKVGFAGIGNPARAVALAAAAVRGAGSRGVVAVAYADAGRAGSLSPAALLDVAARADARGLLLDTADKTGPGLCALQSPLALARLVADAHAAGLFVAMAGKLEEGDLRVVRDTGADIAGVRGAACLGGRTGVTSAERVRRLRAAMSVAHAPDRRASANSSSLADVRV